MYMPFSHQTPTCGEKNAAVDAYPGRRGISSVPSPVPSSVRDLLPSHGDWSMAGATRRGVYGRTGRDADDQLPRRLQADSERH